MKRRGVSVSRAAATAVAGMAAFALAGCAPGAPAAGGGQIDFQKIIATAKEKV